MPQENNEKSGIEQLAANLFDFAIDREDVKSILAGLPPEPNIDLPKVEYELQILKIISVGWAISFYVADSQIKALAAENYWHAVQEFSSAISNTTKLTVGKEIDYFQVLKDRLDMYINALQNSPEAPEPAVIIGPEFSRVCGQRDNTYIVMAGARLFLLTIGGVKSYLESSQVGTVVN